nr:MAG TPA: hypothetical protein [Caudoviricetes sp.]
MFFLCFFIINHFFCFCNKKESLHPLFSIFDR